MRGLLKWLSLTVPKRLSHTLLGQATTLPLHARIDGQDVALLEHSILAPLFSKKGKSKEGQKVADGRRNARQHPHFSLTHVPATIQSQGLFCKDGNTRAGPVNPVIR
jgi:hypothetical protein